MDDITDAAQAATAELCAAFTRMAQLAATMPQWSDSEHPIGAAYQAALYVLELDFPRGRSQSQVPAAVLVRDAVEAVLRERDERRRISHPDAPSDIAIMRAQWINHHSLRRISRDLGRDQKTIRERTNGALAALDNTLSNVRGRVRKTPPHFQRNTQNALPTGRGAISEKRAKPQPRAESAKTALPSSRPEVDAMVAAYVVGGGQIRKAPKGRTRDFADAKKVFHSGKDSVRVDPSGTPGQQAHLRQYGRKRTGTRQRAEEIGVPAKKLPGKPIKDDARIGNAKSHSDEVRRFLFGFGGLDEGRDKEEKETHELVEKFLDPETRERRSELEPQFNEQSSRGKRRRAALTMEFLKSKHGEIRRLRIIERGQILARWVKELTQQRRTPKPEPQRKGLKELKRLADEFLKEARPLKVRGLR